MTLPILYSFRRCPYAIRARLALASAGVKVSLREVVLRDKPQAFLAASPSATVPCLHLPDGPVIDESLDVMIWALGRADPEGLLDMPETAMNLIAACDGAFKAALDRTKYASRYPDIDTEAERARAMRFITVLEVQLARGPWLFGGAPKLADLAILPFVRQFAMIDKPRFDAEAGTDVCGWLDDFLTSDRLSSVMQRYPAWSPGDDEPQFPA